MTEGRAIAGDRGVTRAHGAAAAMVYCISGGVQGQCLPALETACPEAKEL